MIKTKRKLTIGIVPDQMSFDSLSINTNYFNLLPIETLHQIFILSLNNNLFKVSRSFHAISKDPLIRSRWLFEKYGVNALEYCWKMGFMNSSNIKCKCKTHSNSSCDLQDYQKLIIQYLILFNADINSGDSMALKFAAQGGHYDLCKFLLTTGADPNATVFIKKSFRKSKIGGTFKTNALSYQPDIFLLLQAVDRKNMELIQLLLSDASKLTDHVLYKALWCAIINRENFEIAQLLVKQGNAKSSSQLANNFLQVVALSKFRFYQRKTEKLTKLMTLIVESLPNSDFDRSAPGILKTSSDLAMVDPIKACIARGININLFEGEILYSSVYSGSIEVTKYLLTLPQTSVEYFGFRQQSFCIVLLGIEILAILLFTFLIGIWTLSAAGVDFGGEKSGDKTLSVGDLSVMALPALFAMYIMYRLVPFHLLVGAFRLVVRERKRRQAIRNGRVQNLMQVVISPRS